MPVAISNDVNLMAHAEHHFGVGRNYDDALVVNLGWGIGLGLLLNGSVYLGADGFSGEFGHIQVDPHGVQCHCGKNGCLETVASGEAIARIATARLKAGENSLLLNGGSDALNHISAGKIVEAAKQGDEFSIKLLQDSGEAIGKTLAGPVVVSDSRNQYLKLKAWGIESAPLHAGTYDISEDQIRDYLRVIF